jgi:hypothetical protein
MKGAIAPKLNWEAILDFNLVEAQDGMVEGNACKGGVDISLARTVSCIGWMWLEGPPCSAVQVWGAWTMTLPYTKAVSNADEACLLYIDYKQAWKSSSSPSIVSEAPTYGNGSGTMSIGCMGGWIYTGLRGTFAGDLNFCRGWDGGIGWVATSCTPTGATLSMLIFSMPGTSAFPSVSTPSIPLGSTTQCAGSRSSIVWIGRSLWRGEVGLIGGVSLSGTGCSSDATVLPGAVGEVPVSWSSSLGTCVWFYLSVHHAICDWYSMMHHHW